MLKGNNVFYTYNPKILQKFMVHTTGTKPVSTLNVSLFIVTLKFHVKQAWPLWWIQNGHGSTILNGFHNIIQT